MMIKRLALGLSTAAMLAMGTSGAYAANWTMTPETSSLNFAGTQTGKGFTGQFRRFAADITLDPSDLSKASIVVTVDISSFASGSPDRDTDAVTLEWFNAAGFPQAVFTSNKVVHEGGDAYRAIGTLGIKGIEQEIDLPFTLSIDGDNAVANGTIALNRMDFRVGVDGEIEDDHFVGHAVDVTFHVEAQKAQ